MIPDWRLAEAFDGGSLSRTFTIRLMICIGVAGVVSEALPLQRSYWVPLTVAIVLRPDHGSVFARALQRGIGTTVGAVAGAVLVAAIHGTWLLIPFAVLAALLPYGRSRNYGLLCAFPLRAVSEAAQAGAALRAPGKLPDDETLKPITEIVRALLRVLGGGQPLGVRGLAFLTGRL